MRSLLVGVASAAYVGIRPSLGHGGDAVEETWLDPERLRTPELSTPGLSTPDVFVCELSTPEAYTSGVDPERRPTPKPPEPSNSSRSKA